LAILTCQFRARNYQLVEGPTRNLTGISTTCTAMIKVKYRLFVNDISLRTEEHNGQHYVTRSNLSDMFVAKDQAEQYDFMLTAFDEDVGIEAEVGVINGEEVHNVSGFLKWNVELAKRRKKQRSTKTQAPLVSEAMDSDFEVDVSTMTYQQLTQRSVEVDIKSRSHDVANGSVISIPQRDHARGCSFKDGLVWKVRFKFEMDMHDRKLTSVVKHIGFGSCRRSFQVCWKCSTKGLQWFVSMS
jgi:hypothetical protein